MTSYLIYMSISPVPSDNLSCCIRSMYRAWVSKLWPRGHICSTTCFHKSSNKKFYGITAKSIHLQTIYCSFCVMTSELNRCKADHLATKPEIFTSVPPKRHYQVWLASTLMFSVFLQSVSNSQWPLKNHSHSTGVINYCRLPCIADACGLLCDGIIPSLWVLIFQVKVSMTTSFVSSYG